MRSRVEKLTLGQVDENVHDESLDGAMSAAPTRGQLPQQRRHRHQHQHRPHLRNNNHHHGQCHCCQDAQDSQENEKVDEEPTKRPKVNPIFLWALQREQKIIEVRCEDYDKRNRIKLTKTAQGWRSIPRTSSNVYSSCCGYLSKDKASSSSSPSVTSSIPCTMSSKSSSFSSCSESTFSSMSSMKSKDKKKKPKKAKKRRKRYVSDDESETRSSCRNSGISYDLSCDGQHDDYNDHHDRYEFDDVEETTNFLRYGRKTFGLIDLEKLQKNQLLQPRVVLEPLNTSRLRLPCSSVSSKRLDDEIEMIVEEDENIKEDSVTIEEKFISDQEKKEDTDDEVEEIEDKDIEELDESATVFEYEDRDSMDMMDDDEFQEREDNVMNPMEKLPVPENTFYEIPLLSKSQSKSTMQETYLEDIEEVVEAVKNQKKRVPGSIPQVPDLKPINEMDRISKIPSALQSNQASLRVLPSPPCSVTCSEDASRPEVKNSLANTTEKKQKREAPDLIEVKPTEWRRRELRPANQLRELIKRSGGSIPDPLLVPRDRLPLLAASPGIEIPRLLITRPELRLPEALSHPEFLTDPDLLVISLAHLQQVLDSVPEEKSKYGNSSSQSASDKKRLSCKPIGSLMPAPMDLSRHSAPAGQNSILRVRSGLLRRESEVSSTARIPGDDSRLWHPLFGCRQKEQEKPNSKLPLQPQERLHAGNYQQQDSSQRVPWHRTTLAS